MQFPFKIIESKITSRNQFDVVDGCHPTHAFLYIKEGRFTMEIDGHKEVISAGDCVILPDYIHFRRNVEQPIVFVYVKFTRNENCPFSMELPYGKVKPKDKNRFDSAVFDLECLLERDDDFSVCYREHLLMDILFQIYTELNPIGTLAKERMPNDHLVVSAISYIAKNLHQKIRIEDICRAVTTNASTLNFKFRRELGQTVGQFIIAERMKAARHLLVSTTYSLSEIALRCGFENVYYFSNAFKKSIGISPLTYRKQRHPL